MSVLLPAAITAALLSNTAAMVSAVPASCTLASQPARIVQSVKPEYPAIARLYGLAGTTRIRVDLGETGSVLNTYVAVSSGSGVLDQAALRTAKAMVYAPETRSCSGTAGSYAVEVEFAD